MRTSNHLTPAHPEVVAESVSRYLGHLRSVEPQLTREGRIAADHLIDLLNQAKLLGPELTGRDVSFHASDLGAVSDDDVDLLMNEFVLGSGNDGATLLFMGTEEAFDRPGLALGQFGWAAAWLTNSKPDVMRAVECESSKDFEAAPFHRHPYDVVKAGHSRGGTWGALAQVVAAWRQDGDVSGFLEGRDQARLGDLAYLIDRSAAPSKKAPGGVPPQKDRVDFLTWLLGRFAQVRVVVLYGSTGSSASGAWRQANEALVGTFLRSTGLREQSSRLGRITIRWIDDGGRRVILSPALGGSVPGLGDSHREFIGKLIREAVPAC